MRPTEEQDQLEKEKAEQIVAETPLIDGVERITVELADDHGGDPAMWLVFHLSSGLHADDPWIERFTHYANLLSMKILRSGPIRFPYTRMERAA